MPVFLRLYPGALALATLFLFCGEAILAEGPVSGSITISAPAPAIKPAPTAGRSEIGADEIEASGAGTVTEVLASSPGVTATMTGAEGSVSTISIRGSTSNQVLVIVDGSPVSDPSTGLTDFSRLGLDPGDIASVEVLRGGASAQYGADAVGGVILIKTKRGAKGDALAVDLRVSNLSRLPFASVEGSGLSAVDLGADPLALADGQELSLKLGLPSGLSLSAGAERAANGYLYVDANGQRRRRDNAGFLSGRAGATWRGQAGNGLLDASAEGFLRELGVPGPVEAPSPEAMERDATLRASVAFATDEFLSDRVALDASAFGLVSQTYYRGSSAEAADTNLASRAGLDARASCLLSEAISVGTGFAFRYDRLDSTNVRSTDGGTPQRFSVGAYIEPSALLAGWTLTPAARLDWTNDFASGFSLSLGVARTLLPALTMSVNASTAYRAPSFNDLYWPADSGAAGNPALKPESALAGDLGLRYAAEKAAVSATLYARYTKDVILWQPGSDGIWRPSNYGAALYPGFEVEGSLKGEGPLSASLSYTLLHSYLLSGNYGIADDHRVPMVPEHAFELAFNYEKSPLKGRLSLAYKGLRYLGTANVAYDPAHLVVGAHLALETGGASSLELDAGNLLGERYESVQGYPMPGASLRVSWKLRLGASR